MWIVGEEGYYFENTKKLSNEELYKEYIRKLWELPANGYYPLDVWHPELTTQQMDALELTISERNSEVYYDTSDGE